MSSAKTSPTSVLNVFIGTLLSLVLFVFNTTSVAQSSKAPADNLPELGDSSTRYLDAAQEKLIGQQFLRQLIRNPDYVDDGELQDYVQSIGNRIGATADLHGSKLSFNLIENNVLNAFAVPGGYITLNTGLLMVTKTESELASVLGHEIAHLSQRHLSRLAAKTNQDQAPFIAAVIGSIFIGGQVGLAGLTVANAVIASNRLSYTRVFEREADAIGIKLLANANYDTTAMADFFGQLERYTRHDNSEIPEFLRTHPLSLSRITAAESRARQYPPQPHMSSLEFHLAKARIQALYTERGSDPIAFFESQVETEQAALKDVATYGLAIALTATRKLDRARAVLLPLIERYPNHAWIQAAQAEIDLVDKQFQPAIDRYQTLISKHPNKLYLNYRLANALLLNEQPEMAKKIIRYQLRRHPDQYLLYQFLSKTNAAQGLLAEAHQADAEYHATLGNYVAAIESLKLALRESKPAGYLTQSITARIADLEAKIDLQKKNGNG